MLDIKLTKDEITCINLMRKSPPYCKFSIEKRPTIEKPEGELSRLVVETSTLLRDITVIEVEPVESKP